MFYLDNTNWLPGEMITGIDEKGEDYNEETIPVGKKWPQ